MLAIKSFLVKALIFVKLVDGPDQTLSITNIALYIVLYKLLMAQTTSLTDIGALFIGLSSYSYKKYLNQDLVSSLSKNKIVQKAEEIISS